MKRLIILAAGFLVLGFHDFIITVPEQAQIILFFIGLFLFGIPHGAADLLIADKTAKEEMKNFSKLQFFTQYLGRLSAFGVLLWLFPTVGFLLFLLFAAYHFGETDLNQFDTDGAAGKLLAVSYGAAVLGIILLNHFEELKPLILLSGWPTGYEKYLLQISYFRLPLLSLLVFLFFSSVFFYFLTHKISPNRQEYFLIQFALMIYLLYQLPLLLGFTFYFIIWHSILSLNIIIEFLRRNDAVSAAKIIQQIILYSALAFIGIGIFGFAGWIYLKRDALFLAIFAGLAVLTAPHLRIMHDMYNRIRINQSGSA